MVTVCFALIYKLMPRVRVAWRDVWIGAAVTALLFTIGKQLIGLYIGTSSVASGFGAAGSLVVLLVWVYYSAQIFLLGAEFTWVYAHSHGSLRGTRLPAGADRLEARRLQPANPPSARKRSSSGVLARPSSALRCGKRPKRSMMSRCSRAKR